MCMYMRRLSFHATDLSNEMISEKQLTDMSAAGSKNYKPRRTGERQRKSVRGCIVGADLAVLNLVVTKKGEQEIPGLTDVDCPRRLAPKRASKIRKLFNLTKADDVRKYVVRRTLAAKEGKKAKSKAPKIQRLVLRSDALIPTFCERPHACSVAPPMFIFFVLTALL